MLSAATLKALDARLRDLPSQLAAPSPEEGSSTIYSELAQRAEKITIAGAPALVRAGTPHSHETSGAVLKTCG